MTTWHGPGEDIIEAKGLRDDLSLALTYGQGRASLGNVQSRQRIGHDLDQEDWQ